MWPVGSTPLPICDWKHFRQFWSTHYPKMFIRPPSHDTCAECWKYKNELGKISRLQNETRRSALHSQLSAEYIAHLEVNVRNNIQNTKENMNINANANVESRVEETQDSANINANVVVNVNANENLNSNNVDVDNGDANVEGNEMNVEDSEQRESSDNKTNSEIENYCTVQKYVDGNDLFDPLLLEQSNNELAPPFIRAEEATVSKYMVHVTQFANMRNHVKTLIATAKQHHKTDTPWQQCLYVQIADFAQNLDLPHFGSEQPGDIYYFSPLGIYLFGMVNAYLKSESLFCQ